MLVVIHTASMLNSGLESLLNKASSFRVEKSMFRWWTQRSTWSRESCNVIVSRKSAAGSILWIGWAICGRSGSRHCGRWGSLLWFVSCRHPRSVSVWLDSIMRSILTKVVVKDMTSKKNYLIVVTWPCNIWWHDFFRITYASGEEIETSKYVFGWMK